MIWYWYSQVPITLQKYMNLKSLKDLFSLQLMNYERFHFHICFCININSHKFSGDWLQNFAYRVDPGILSFLMASLLALLIAILTVVLRAYIAARANPADSPRYE